MESFGEMLIFVNNGRVSLHKMKSKRASIMQQVIIQIILIGLIFAIFLFASAERVNARDVKQQVLEKQIALLIDSAEAGMNFEIKKVNVNGLVENIEIKEGKVFVKVEGFPSVKGYPYFSKYSVGVKDNGDKFVVSIQ